MLRITRSDDREAGVITLRAEGRIVSDWVQVLERQCQAALGEGRQVDLDLGGVTFIDGRGVAMLRGVRSGRLQLVHCSGFLAGLLECDR